MGRKTKMNSITSPELLSQINPQNTELLNDFLEYLRSTQRSDSTIDGYKSDIEIAFVWNLQNNGNKFFVDWTKRNVVAYQNWLLMNNENSPARVRRLKSALSSMSNFIENVLDDEFPDFRNIINKVESPINEPVREKTVLSSEEVQSILDKLVDEKKYKMACLVALAAYGGRRKAELLRFKMSDFTDDRLVCDGALWKSAPIKTKGRARGKYLNCYTLVKPFRPYLDMWIKEREEKGIESEWLFPADNDPSQPMQISTVNSWMNTLSASMGIPIYAHAFRHHFTTSLAKAGIPDGVIQSIVAWDSADMVRLYKDIDADEEIGMYFKNGEINVPKSRSLGDI